MVRAKTPTDEKFEKQDFNLFEAIAAIDKKDYGYYDRLTPEQQRKFVPFMMLHWIVDLFIIAPLSIAIGWFARGYFG